MAVLLDYALTDLASVKETLSISSGDHSKDNLIIRKINQATVMIENYCGRRFKATDYTNEEYDSTHTDQLVLKNRPIISLTNIGTRDTSLNEDDWEITDSQLYFADNSAGVLDLNFYATGRWNRLRVTYRAGYETIPADLAEAAATLAAFYVENNTSGQAIRTKEEGQRRIEYYNTKSGNSAGDSLMQQLGIDDILNAYSNYPISADK